MVSEKVVERSYLVNVENNMLRQSVRICHVVLMQTMSREEHPRRAPAPIDLAVLAERRQLQEANWFEGFCNPQISSPEGALDALDVLDALFESL